jgi:hypothetical protein
MRVEETRQKLEKTPEMEFLDINLTTLKSWAPCKSQFLTGGFYKKPHFTLVLKINTKIRGTRKLESIHEKHFV